MKEKHCSFKCTRFRHFSGSGVFYNTASNDKAGKADLLSRLLLMILPRSGHKMLP